MEQVPAVVIGAGQAGLATSRELTLRGVEHVVLDAGEVGQTWRSRRWDSFRLVSPNWLNRLPGHWYEGPDPEGFLTAAGMLDYLEGYAASFGAPLRTGCPVRAVVHGTSGLVLQTGGGDISAASVVIATGAFGGAWLPPLAGSVPARIRSLHSDDYRSPGQLPPGGVLVVGTGQSGLQIADELLRDGRAVMIAVGRHGWVPRRLYGRDQMDWRLQNGDFRAIVADPDNPSADHPFTILSRWGAHDFNVRTVWAGGARLAGRLITIDGERATFAPDLRELLEAGDAHARTFAGRVRDFARARGEDVPEPVLDSHWRDGEMPPAPPAIDLRSEGINTVIWATGYRQDFSWIELPGALAGNGAPYQRQGVSPVPGLYFVGLHRMWEAGAGTILGCGWVAEHVAQRIAAAGAGQAMS